MILLRLQTTSITHTSKVYILYLILSFKPVFLTHNNFFIDIARIAALGVPVYSFSIAWPRVFPFGKGQVNEVALEHYDDVINTCLEYNVEPIVTLYHWLVI